MDLVKRNLAITSQIRTMQGKFFHSLVCQFLLDMDSDLNSETRQIEVSIICVWPFVLFLESSIRTWKENWLTIRCKDSLSFRTMGSFWNPHKILHFASCHLQARGYFPLPSDCFFGCIMFHKIWSQSILLLWICILILSSHRKVWWSDTDG